MTRLHERVLEAIATRVAETWVLTSPAPGWFFPLITRGDLVARGHAIGELEVLGRRTRVNAGEVSGVAQGDNLPRAVGFGDPLIVLDTAAQVAGAAAGVTGAQAAPSTVGLVFRAPTSGRFYGRSSPDKPPFVSVGDELAPGATICLLEVMKTFHRVTYGGAGLPERAKIREILVADGADVTAGDALLALE
jgi:acetyl-CoA carboxylase biotin carboxyl carrier protein